MLRINNENEECKQKIDEKNKIIDKLKMEQKLNKDELSDK